MESIALQTADDIGSIHDVQRAYACVEKLITPQRVNDSEEVYPTRSELSALLQLLNDELQRRIETADAAIRSVRKALAEGGAP